MLKLVDEERVGLTGIRMHYTGELTELVATVVQTPCEQGFGEHECERLVGKHVYSLSGYFDWYLINGLYYIDEKTAVAGPRISDTPTDFNDYPLFTQYDDVVIFPLLNQQLAKAPDDGLVGLSVLRNGLVNGGGGWVNPESPFSCRVRRRQLQRRRRRVRYWQLLLHRFANPSTDAGWRHRPDPSLVCGSGSARPDP
jgi:hypothetical protein